MKITGKQIYMFTSHIVGTFNDYIGSQDAEERDLHFMKLTAFYMSGFALGILREVSVFVDVMYGVEHPEEPNRNSGFHDKLLQSMTDEARDLYNEYERNRRESNEA